MKAGQQRSIGFAASSLTKDNSHSSHLSTLPDPHDFTHSAPIQLSTPCYRPRSSVLQALSNYASIKRHLPRIYHPDTCQSAPWHLFTMAPLQSKTNNSSSNRGGRFISASAYVVDRSTMLKGYHYSATGADGKHAPTLCPSHSLLTHHRGTVVFLRSLPQEFPPPRQVPLLRP